MEKRERVVGLDGNRVDALEGQQLGQGGLGLVLAQALQAVGQPVFHRFHAVHAQAAAVEPGLALVGVERAAVGGGAEHAAQALDLGQGGAGLAGGPQIDHPGVGELGKHLQAALLRFDQVQQALLFRGLGVAGGKQGRAGRALLARKLLALHEVEQRSELARHLGVGGAVGRLEHHGQQTGDQARIGVGGLAGSPAQ